jgi:hypothetical protein
METVTYNGKDYEIKSFNGYHFASEELFNAMLEDYGDESDFEGEAFNIDSQIAFFFTPEEFEFLSAEEMYIDYDNHS